MTNALEILRGRRSRLARSARWWALAAAIAFALPPALHAPAMAAAPAGFVAVCTAEGVAYIPADPGLPPMSDLAPEAANAGACHACCQGQTASPPPAGLALAAPPLVREAAIGGAPAASVLRPTHRPFSRGPPLV